MSFTIPNKDTALADAQSVLFKEHLDILVAGIEGIGVTEGCAVTPSAGMVVAVAAGGIIRSGIAAVTPAATRTLATAHASLHRFDTVVINAANAVAVRQGVAVLTPAPATLTAGDIPLAMVFIPATTASITAANITDTRIDVPTDKPSLNATLTAIADGSMGAFSHRNKIINGGFAINQRGYVSGAATTAGQYTLDRWKVTGTGGITFSTTANKTTVTIPADQALQQVIEGLNLQSGTHVLSWEGTAQGKIDAGAYGASGITGAITGGANTTIEFGPGTVANVQLEAGSVATSFEHRPIGTELALCQRYYEKSFSYGTSPANGGNLSSFSTSVGLMAGIAVNAQGRASSIAFKVSKRSIPTIFRYGNNAGQWRYVLPSEPASWGWSVNLGGVNVSTEGFAVDQQVVDGVLLVIQGHWAASAEL